MEPVLGIKGATAQRGGSLWSEEEMGTAFQLSVMVGGAEEGNRSRAESTQEPGALFLSARATAPRKAWQLLRLIEGWDLGSLIPAKKCRDRVLDILFVLI